MRTRQEIIDRIDELNDSISCAEHDEEVDGDTSVDVDSLRCEVADLRLEFKERFSKVDSDDN